MEMIVCLNSGFGLRSLNGAPSHQLVTVGSRFNQELEKKKETRNKK